MSVSSERRPVVLLGASLSSDSRHQRSLSVGCEVGESHRHPAIKGQSLEQQPVLRLAASVSVEREWGNPWAMEWAAS